MGELTEKIIAFRGYTKVNYPVFESYSKRLYIKNVNSNTNLDYEGGFTIRGRNLNGSGTIDNLAKLKFSYNDKEFLVAESINFLINDEGVISNKAKIKFREMLIIFFCI